MSASFPQAIAPTVQLTKELESLLEFLTHQKPSVAAGDREFNELAQLSEKELDAKIRELENWNFRLNLDEAKEMRDSISLGIVSEQHQSTNS
ncbi:hypothetical protein PHYBOEH_008279 [Phytophthora boehmeriae]|uniref:Uncharacterized protein n=1 Tax=Phytophthora boehmeriae TaxID=109152 RepID=A0A8T1X1P5_9STRA|nr:hypothetical protein PHYBOEH_008279 [Phytophthora boehmeriae]